MDRRKRDKQTRDDAVQPPPPLGFWTRWWPVVVVIAALLLIVFWPRGPKRPTQPPEPEKPPASAPAPSEDKTPEPDTPSAKSSTRRAGAQDVVGAWLRQDVPYVLEIKKVASDGKAEASYQNPQVGPIKVSKAEVSTEDGDVRVFVELNDPAVGYPGCVYRLQYDPQQDVMIGSYYQAQQGVTHQGMVFMRHPNSTPNR